MTKEIPLIVSIKQLWPEYFSQEIEDPWINKKTSEEDNKSKEQGPKKDDEKTDQEAK